MVCKNCGYPLHGLPSPRCPECGRDFDPSDTLTFDSAESSRRQPFAGLVLMIGGSVLAAATVAAGLRRFGLILDFGPAVAALLGFEVYRARRTAAILCVIVMAVYGASNALAIAGGMSRSGVAGAVGTPHIEYMMLHSIGLAWASLALFPLVEFVFPVSLLPASRTRRFLPATLCTVYLFLLVVAIAAVYGANRDRKLPARRSAEVSALDHRTGAPLPITLIGPTTDEDGSPWSVTYRAVTPDRFVISWIPVRPLPISVRSEGFEEQRLVIDPSTPARVEIRLKRRLSN